MSDINQLLDALLPAALNERDPRGVPVLLYSSDPEAAATRDGLQLLATLSVRSELARQRGLLNLIHQSLNVQSEQGSYSVADGAAGQVNLLGALGELVQQLGANQAQLAEQLQVIVDRLREETPSAEDVPVQAAPEQGVVGEPS